MVAAQPVPAGVISSDGSYQKKRKSIPRTNGVVEQRAVATCHGTLRV